MEKIVNALTGLFLLGVVGVANAAYVTVGDGVGSDPVQLDFVSWNPNYVQDTYFRTIQINWKITNTTGSTFNDVKFVLPFVAYASGGTVAYNWDNTNQIWHSSAYNGLNGVPDGIDAWASNSSGTALTNFLLMSDTDIPLTSGSASVLSTDSVPDWDIVPTLTAGQVVSFTTYIRQERSNNVGGLWVTPYVVAVPVPAAVWLFGSGLLGLIGVGRKRA